MSFNFKSIGWIGTGVMGKSMCKHLMNNGYNLSVFNRSKDKSEELITMGAKFMDPIKMTDKCNIIFTMLWFPKDIENIVLGEEGILKKMKPGSILVDHTTSSPDLAEYIYKEAKRFGIISYDALYQGEILVQEMEN